MESVPYEIERKFLIEFPDEKFICSVADNTDIVQTYLKSEGPGISERVRKRGSGTEFCYTHTLKKRINDMRRVELENEVSPEEYQELLKRADTERNVIYKKRLCYHYNNQMFEIDLYPFWTDRAVMEIELSDENQSVDFPPEIKIIREITADKRYTNASMAKQIPDDSL